jgi:hypothetical protein
VPVGLRLFLPDEWIAGPERCAKACVPQAMQGAHNKGEIALAELDRLWESDVRFWRTRAMGPAPPSATAALMPGAALA